MRCFIASVLIIMLATMPIAAHAKTAMKTNLPVVPSIVVTYDVYVGGIHFITADILFQELDHKYHALVKAHTYGFWYKTLPWDTTLETNGRILKNRFAPIEYHNSDKWGKKPPKSTTLRFDKSGNVTPSFDPPNHDENRDAPTTEQRKGSLDPVTALLQMLAHLSVQDDCNVSVTVFDGKMLFSVTGNDTGTDEIDEGDYNSFKGEARTCDANFKIIAGEWKDRTKSRFWKRSDNEEGRDPFHVWLGTLSPGLPEMPVKLESGSIWGLIVMHLSGWRPATTADGLK